MNRSVKKAKNKGMRVGVLLAGMMMASGCAAAQPELNNVFATDAMLIAGEPGWGFEFETSEAGRLAAQLIHAQSGAVTADIGACDVQAGAGRIEWDGVLEDGTHCEAGSYMVAVQLRNAAGEMSEQILLSLYLFEDDAQAEAGMLDLALLEDVSAAQPIAEEAEDTAAETGGVPQASSFWDMDPDAYDLSDPQHQKAIWDLMMQPITVLDVGDKEHVYPTHTPGAQRTPYEQNTAGELHGQSQGVHVLEEDEDGDGYVLIESYSNDGTVTKNDYMKSIDAQKIRGYVKKSLLFEVTPSDKYALLVDKLRQRMYVFEDGKIIGTLLVSTGLNNEKQPYNETPAGEFITVSRVGDFNAGGHTIGRLAIRINGGTLLHEVLHDKAADGTRIYREYEPQLGMKASHGCVRIQRRQNEQGQNMQWLWDNLELRTKVFIWDDKGRSMYEPELPDGTLQLYRNPNGGSNYHLDAECSGVKKQYLPLSGDLTYADLQTSPFDKLTPCVYCAAPERPETLYERYCAAAEQIGAEVTDEVRAAYGVR